MSAKCAQSFKDRAVRLIGTLQAVGEQAPVDTGKKPGMPTVALMMAWAFCSWSSIVPRRGDRIH